MQQVETRQLSSNGDSVQYAWRNDEEEMVHALMGLAWHHHVSRWKRIRMAAVGLLNAMSIGATVSGAESYSQICVPCEGGGPRPAFSCFRVDTGKGAS